jgi:glutamate 5-kinase
LWVPAAGADAGPCETEESNDDMGTVVVKVGTTTLTEAGGQLDREFIGHLAEQIAGEMARGVPIILVTSGAIRAGAERLGWRVRPRTVPMKQAAAAVGQGLLMETYAAAFARHGLPVGQVLLTRQDVANRTRYVNAKNTLTGLLRWGVVPIVNENDTVSTEEIRFGDNDTLAALVAALAEAERLILLTNVDGVLDGTGAVIPEVPAITDEVRRWAGGAGANGTGGMITKLQAAAIAAEAGIATMVAHGRRPHVLRDLLAGAAIGTRILPKERPLRGRKRWIALGAAPRGTITVNACAKRALVHEFKSLLPVGIVRIQGDFHAGDTVSLMDEHGLEFARGVVGCNTAEAVAVMGRQTTDIAQILGRSDFQELVHRDNLVLLE